MNRLVRNKLKRRLLDGVLLLDKPRGISSNDILQKVKWIFRAKKAGHTGSLDPLATGLLPICFGESTKLSSLLLGSNKQYLTIAKLGEITDTSDAEGQVIGGNSAIIARLNEQQIISAVNTFVGKQQQAPSLFSALKYQGKPLYYYARKGIEVDKKVREIEIEAISIEQINLPFVTLRIDCSKGTYIRTLVEDIGNLLGCGAHVVELRRTSILGYEEQQAITFEQLQQISDQFKIGEENIIEEKYFAQLDQHLLAVDSIASQLAKIELDNSQSKDICQGKFLPIDLSKLNVNPISNLSSFEMVRIYNHELGYIGIAKIIEGTLRPYRLHSNTAQIIQYLGSKLTDN